MLDSYPVIIIIGTTLGFLSGLGIGGGSLLIVWLTSVLDMEPEVARNINLMFFIPSAVISSLIRYKKGQLDLKTPLPGILGGCVFAIVGYWISTKLDVAFMKKLLGAVLVITGFRELLYRDRKAR